MEIPAAPIGAGQNISGKVSWFGGPNDVTDSGHTASGGTTREPGIAVYNRATLGGYWRVTDPKTGRMAVLKQTDLGPAPWTGRKIDVTYSALGKLGYSEGTFPTDSEMRATYLGKNASGMALSAPSGFSQRPSTLSPSPTAQPPSFNAAAFQRAQRASLVGKLIASEGGAKENPLLASGLAMTKVPLRSEYTSKSVSNSTIPRLPGVSRATNLAAGAQLGGFLPKGAPLEMKRIDQGQDIQTAPGETIIAPGDGKVIAVKSDPSGFGPSYPVVKFTSGPLAGQSWYIGHTDSALREGQEFKAGETIARTSRTGHNAPPGWAEIGIASALGSGNMQAGRQTIPYLRRR